MTLSLAFGFSWIILGILGFLLVGPLQALVTGTPGKPTDGV